MKRLVIYVACLLMTMSLFVACGDDKDKDKNKDNSNSSKDVTIDVEKLATELYDNIKFKDEMLETEDDFFYSVFSVNKEDVEKQKSYISAGVTTERVIIVQCKDEEAADRVKTVFETYAKTTSDTYASYAPEESNRMQNAIIETYGKYVVFCATEDNNAAEKIIKGQVE